MRRSLIVTVAAATSMVLLAMLVPIAVLLRSYALEERTSRAALEVQATETVVSGQDRGDVAVYVDRINRADEGVRTTVLYPDGVGVGPDPGEDADVVEARATGRASLLDAGGGVEFLVPVSLGGTNPTAQETPVIRVHVDPPGLTSGLFGAWLILAALGVVLLGGALVLADRIGRSFVAPISRLATYAGGLGAADRTGPAPAEGPAEVRDLAAALNRLVVRVEELLERERRSVADLSHRLRTPITALRLRIEGLPPGADRARLAGDLDGLEGMVDHVVREARRSEREGLVPGTDGVGALADRVAFWEPLAEEQGRAFSLDVAVAAPVAVRASADDLRAAVDVLLDNVFTHTPDDAAVSVSIRARPAGGLVLTVDDAGPGFPTGLDVVDRGTSGGGSSGLGLSIVERTATESGGGLALLTSPWGGGRVVVELGPPG